MTNRFQILLSISTFAPEAGYADVQRRVRRNRALLDAGRLLAGSVDTSTVLERAVGETRRIMRAERQGLTLVHFSAQRKHLLWYIFGDFNDKNGSG